MGFNKFESLADLKLLSPTSLYQTLVFPDYDIIKKMTTPCFSSYTLEHVEIQMDGNINETLDDLEQTGMYDEQVAEFRTSYNELQARLQRHLQQNQQRRELKQQINAMLYVSDDKNSTSQSNTQTVTPLSTLIENYISNIDCLLTSHVDSLQHVDAKHEDVNYPLKNLHSCIKQEMDFVSLVLEELKLELLFEDFIVCNNASNAVSANETVAKKLETLQQQMRDFLDNTKVNAPKQMRNVTATLFPPSPASTATHDYVVDNNNINLGI